MGLQHDRYNEPSNYPFPYSHGYVNQAAFEPGAPPESRFATNMAYNSQCRDAGFFCPWTNTFSNPDLTYNGYPLGVPGDEPSSAVDGPADARRSLNELRTTVANFRVRDRDRIGGASAAVSDPTLESNQGLHLLGPRSATRDSGRNAVTLPVARVRDLGRRHACRDRRVSVRSPQPRARRLVLVARRTRDYY